MVKPSDIVLRRDISSAPHGCPPWRMLRHCSTTERSITQQHCGQIDDGDQSSNDSVFSMKVFLDLRERYSKWKGRLAVIEYHSMYGPEEIAYI
jgi:hypothetical protein